MALRARCLIAVALCLTRVSHAMPCRPWLASTRGASCTRTSSLTTCCWTLTTRSSWGTWAWPRPWTSTGSASMGAAHLHVQPPRSWTAAGCMAPRQTGTICVGHLHAVAPPYQARNGSRCTDSGTPRTTSYCMDRTLQRFAAIGHFDRELSVSQLGYDASPRLMRAALFFHGTSHASAAVPERTSHWCCTYYAACVVLPQPSSV